jgi:glycosyltransferase involved in cell wall biosynthesis
MKILFIDGTGGFYPQRLEEKPTGGILTSLTLIPRYLASKGLDVTVMSAWNHDAEHLGVKYIKHPTDRTDFDVVVFNRNMLSRPLAEQFKNSRKVWWLHDVVDPTYLEDDGYRLVDDIVALSAYCAESYADFYGIPRDKFTVIPNGVDKRVFHADPSVKRRGNLFVTASAPIKGLYPLEYTLRNMLRWDEKMELRVYSSQKLHELENQPSHKALLERLKAAGAQILDPIPQHELAAVLREATALLMPNSYPEICSNLLLQAQACGCPVVATGIGSVPEFIQHGETGLYTHTGPQDLYWWHKNFAALCAQVYFDEATRKAVSAQSPRAVRSWPEIGALWETMLLAPLVEAA